MKTGMHTFPRQDAIVWGRPAAEAVSEHLASTGNTRAFIITNRSLRDSEIVGGIRSALGNRFVGAYPECGAHSPREAVLAGSIAARQAGADVLVAVGGGSVIDAAKVMVACLWQDAFDPSGLSALRTTLRQKPAGMPTARMIAVPTTLAAAEFTPLAGITDVGSGTKELFEHEYLIPACVALDPVATLQTPEWLFASTGIRSVDHCVETICSAQASPFGTAVAREGLRLLAQGLTTFSQEPSDLDNRLTCQVASWLAIAGPVSGVPVGASHAIGRVLGGAFGVPHGHTSCALLPAVLQWNAQAGQGQQSEVAAALGAREASASASVAALVSRLKQPRTLRDLGIDRNDFASIAAKSMLMMSHPGTSGNQRPVKTEQDVIEILELAY